MTGSRSSVAVMLVLAMAVSMCTCVMAVDGEREVQPDGRNRVLFQHTFKPPFYFSRSSSIPFWDFGGHAIATQDYVRLTSTEQSQTGYMWNKVPMESDAWEVSLTFQVGGGGRSYGADGFAFWYTKDIRQEGEVYGMTHEFQGLMIAFDTFDNDNLGNNPRILAATTLTPGTKYDTAGDGKAHELGGCVAYFRNLEKPSKVRITYQQGVLDVLTDIAGTGEYKQCIHVNDIHLPTGYHFGLTAATGGLADNHDAISLITRDLNPWRKTRTQQQEQKQEQKQEQQQQVEEVTQQVEELQQQQDQGEEKTETNHDDALHNIRTAKQMKRLKHKHQRERGYSNNEELKQKHEEELEAAKRRFQDVKDGAEADAAAGGESGNDEDNEDEESLSMAKSATHAPSGVLPNLLRALSSLHKLQENFAGELEHIHEAIERNSVLSQTTEVLKQQESIKGHLFENTKSLGDFKELVGEMRLLRTELIGLKKIMSNQIKRGNQDMAYRVNQLGTEVNNIKKAIEAAHHGQQEIVRTLDTNMGGLNDTVQQSSNSFWFWFVLFQLALIAAVWAYIKYYRERNQKLM